MIVAGVKSMYVIITKIVNVMQDIFVLWNGFWWNYHIGRAKIHDERIQHLDPTWREKI